MAERFRQSILYFQTYEAREDAFREKAFSMIPRKYLVPGPFWKDFRSISMVEFSKISHTPIAFVTSNPRDCLSFGTPGQVLGAACLRGKTADPRFSLSVAEIAKTFGIQGTLRQPVRSLSGGETVKLALAKSYAAAAATTRLVIASPFSWLSQDNVSYLWQLVRHYDQLNIPVDILALADEDSHRPIEGEEYERIDWAGPAELSIRFEGVQLNLGTSFNTLYSHNTRVNVDNFSAVLSSPCLMVGENGQGKSLVARILARAVAFTGHGSVGPGSEGKGARLLFQDVVAQTLLRSFDAISGSIGAHRKPEVRSLYEEILDGMGQLGEKRHSRGNLAGQTGDRGPLSLIAIKAVLVAVRLCTVPGALILDEPDWGMARSDAIAFVAAVIRAAHARGVPVLIISHKPWWRSIAGDSIAVERTATSPHGERESRFRITLHRKAGDTA